MTYWTWLRWLWDQLTRPTETDTEKEQDTMEPQQESPMTPMEMQAAHLQELFVAFLNAGFSEGQALYLVAVAMSGGARGPL